MKRTAKVPADKEALILGSRSTPSPCWGPTAVHLEVVCSRTWFREPHQSASLAIEQLPAAARMKGNPAPFGRVGSVANRRQTMHVHAVAGNPPHNRSFDTDAQRRSFASLRPSPSVAGQLQRYMAPGAA